MLVFVTLISVASCQELAFAQSREIAITIDDLPFVGSSHGNEGNLRREKERFTKIMDDLVKQQVPATGFVIAGSIEKGQWELLETFHDNGFTIGNHTYSHANLNKTGAEKYIDDIKKADEVLTPLMDKNKYFRYPYLAEGKGQSKQAVQEYLASLNYNIAPVTIDTKDFKFNEQLLSINWRSRASHVNRIKNIYLNYIWQQTLKAEKRNKDKPVKQILLIHANLINSHAMNDIIQMYKDNGYKFITLDEAMESHKKDIVEPNII